MIFTNKFTNHLSQYINKVAKKNIKNVETYKQDKFQINRKLIISIFLVSFVVPVYYTIYNVVNNLPLKVVEFIMGYVFTLNVTLVVTYTCGILVNRIMIILPWDKGFSKRLSFELLVTNINASIWVTVVFLIYSSIAQKHFAYVGEKNIASNIFDSIIIAIIINTTFVLVTEGDFLLKKWRNSIIETEKIKTEKEQLEKENILSQFQALKNQVNPHFLFNSLSVLGSLIQTDPKKAEEFVSKFSKIYRYVLDVKDEQVVELSRELDFVKSYYFLQKVRYSENFTIQYDLDPKYLEFLVPPLSLQLLLENAVKHNIISDKLPLEVKIFTDNDFLIVKNNYQKRDEPVNSSGVGLENLKRRYKLLTELEPTYSADDSFFTAKIPMLNDD